MAAEFVKRIPAAKARWAGLTVLALAGAALWLHAGQADKPKSQGAKGDGSVFYF